MMIIASMGGNALLKCGAETTAEHQRANVERAVASIAPLIRKGHRLVISHGNGPQVGLLALQAAASGKGSAPPLDILVAQTQGSIGYQIEQALQNALGSRGRIATLLTQVEVSDTDPSFKNPTKPIGLLYDKAEAARIATESAWVFKPQDAKYRRVVASPLPLRILNMNVIRMLVANGTTVVCGGGGGIPVRRGQDGELTGVEAVIDKDWTSAMLGEELDADFLLLLTDVDAVYEEWGTPQRRAIRRAMPDQMRKRSYPEGSMGPKVAAACHFVEATGGCAGIGKLADAVRILEGDAGTFISPRK